MVGSDKKKVINIEFLRRHIDNIINNMSRSWGGVTIKRVDSGPTYMQVDTHKNEMNIFISVETVLQILETTDIDSVASIVSYLLAHELGHVNIAIENRINGIDISKNDHELQNIAEDLEINWRSSIPECMGIHAKQYGFEEYLNWNEYYDLLIKDKEKHKGSTNFPKGGRLEKTESGVEINTSTGNNTETKQSQGELEHSPSSGKDMGPGEVCGCDTKKLHEDLNKIPLSSIERIKWHTEEISLAVQSEIAANNPIFEEFQTDNIPKEWEDIIKNLKKNSRDPYEVPYIIEPSYFRLNNRRGDSDGLILPGDEFIEKPEGPERNFEQETVIFIDISSSMRGKELGINHVINACNKYRVGMVFYNTNIVAISDDVLKIRKMPSPFGGTMFRKALDEYLETKPEPEHVYIVTDGYDDSLMKYLRNNKKAMAWYIKPDGLPMPIKV